jgi:hypothetical protein
MTHCEIRAVLNDISDGERTKAVLFDDMPECIIASNSVFQHLFRNESGSINDSEPARPQTLEKQNRRGRGEGLVGSDDGKTVRTHHYE